MIPSFTRVALTLKSLIDDKVNVGESRIILSPYISKATLDIIGLVGENFFLILIFLLFLYLFFLLLLYIY